MPANERRAPCWRRPSSPEASHLERALRSCPGAEVDCRTSAPNRPLAGGLERVGEAVRSSHRIKNAPEPRLAASPLDLPQELRSAPDPLRSRGTPEQSSPRTARGYLNKYRTNLGTPLSCDGTDPKGLPGKCSARLVTCLRLQPFSRQDFPAGIARAEPCLRPSFQRHAPAIIY